VNGSLGLGDATEDRQGSRFDRWQQVAPLEQIPDLGVIPTMNVVCSVMVFMFLIMRVAVSFVLMTMVATAVMMLYVVVVMMIGMDSLVPVVTLDKKSPTGNTSPDRAFEPAGGQGDREGRQGLVKNRLGHAEIPKCCHGHVAADSGEGIDMEDFHGVRLQGSPCRCKRSRFFGSVILAGRVPMRFNPPSFTSQRLYHPRNVPT
jgi:hypothetical protein